MAQLTRRGFMGVALGGGALICAPGLLRAQAAGSASAAALMQAAQLGGDIGFVVADLRSGQVLEEFNGARALPPASTAKAITTLYALETLGAGWRFGTHVMATGPVSGGIVQGDLVLAGGGDPTLSTDDLAGMARALAARGVRGVTGRFLVWGGALPYAPEIAGDQPVQAGYNPAVSGLILNFNRVHFEWRRAGNGWQLGMDARGATVQPRAYTAEARVANRRNPLFTYADRNGKEVWTVASEALGRGGSRWLPVRQPERYAGDVFQTLARAQGTPLPGPVQIRNLPPGAVTLVSHSSDPLPGILRDMMRFSTNLTAEAVGMTASARRGASAGLGRSGAAMSQWLRARAGLRAARFVDHSGLGVETRIPPAEMVAALRVLGVPMGLRGLMRPFELRDDTGRKRAGQSLRIDAKTGTLNFVSTLAGYMSVPGGREMVFAIFTGDVARRAGSRGQEAPAGADAWVKRSKILQSRLLERWAAVYG